jgi:hypothetical protein
MMNTTKTVKEVKKVKKARTMKMTRNTILRRTIQN